MAMILLLYELAAEDAMGVAIGTVLVGSRSTAAKGNGS